ncbi:MAG: branched-chain amino acid transaminase [Caldilineae bacterium]|nr:branched-chain amino acid transaminase [Anaerolineae bacterium]MCB0205221.1 branched-chain amino acid transaminase [Anaerolineae bacterium]MCB0256251.1 branched-chain amino acid transaminase [Anaerolineae bacterium]MCB9153674.1 branched-chain amino acid transaminase [Caldilineae bacterium]
MQTKYAFFEGQIVPIEQAQVSVMTHALHYGTACFGGIRAYWNDEAEQLYVFRIEDHIERFLTSARLLLMNVAHSPEKLRATVLDLLRCEGFRADTYVRPLAYKADLKIGVMLHGMTDEVTIFATPFGRYIEKEEGADVCVSTWRRIDDNAIPARGKIAGAYVNSAFVKSEALMDGYDEAIVLDQHGHVSEGSAENLFMVRNGKLITPSITANILEGITRRTIMELATNELGLEVEEREIDRTELYICDELFFCGTGVQVAAIATVDRRPVGSGKIGPVTKSIRDLYFDVVKGNVAKYRGWNTPVYVEA